MSRKRTDYVHAGQVTVDDLLDLRKIHAIDIEYYHAHCKGPFVSQFEPDVLTSLCEWCGLMIRSAASWCEVYDGR